MVRKLLLTGLLLGLSCVTTMNNTDLAKEYYSLGTAYYELKKYKEASTYFSRAVALDATLNQAGYSLARALAETGDYDGAWTNLDQLLAKDPANLLVRKTQAWIRYQQDRKAEALSLYQMVLEASPADADSLYNAGLVSYDLNKNQEALKYLEAWQALGNSGNDFLRLLADVYQRLDLKEKTIATLEALAKADDKNRLAWATLADLQESLKHYDKMLAALLKLETLGSSASGAADPALLYRIAVLQLTQINDEAKALEYFGKALEAGFKDKDKVKELLATKDLFRKAKVEAFFKDKKFFDEPKADDKKPAAGAAKP